MLTHDDDALHKYYMFHYMYAYIHLYVVLSMVRAATALNLQIFLINILIKHTFENVVIIYLFMLYNYNIYIKGKEINKFLSQNLVVNLK